MRKRFIGSILLTILLLLFSTSNLYAITVDLRRLTFGFFREDWPVIHKNKVFWLEEGIIRGYDFKDNEYFNFLSEEQPLTNLFGLVEYDGRYIVYNRFNDENSYDVSVYDTKKEEETFVTNDQGSQSATDYDDKVIVFFDGGACGTLYAYDLRKEERVLVSENACSPAKISKGTIVWAYAAPGGANVYGYNLKTKTQFDIANGEGVQSSPDIYGSNVVWIYFDGVGYAVQIKNLKTGKIKTLHQSYSNSMSWPSISKRYAVWGKNTEQHVSGVEGIDLLTNKIFEIQEQGPHQNDNLSPLVVDNIVAWMAWRTGNGDIYAAELLHRPPRK